MSMATKRLLWMCGLAVVVTLAWYLLPQLAPKVTWAVDRAMLAVAVGLLASLFVERVLDGS